MTARLACQLAAFFSSLSAPVMLLAQPSNNDSSHIVKIEQQLLDDIAPGITANWSKYMHPDCVIVTEDGSVLDKKSFIDDMQPMPTGITGHITLIKPRFVAVGNTAVITYVADEYESVYQNQLHTTYSVMNTYVKHDTDWQFISMHIFEIPQLPATIHLSATILQKYAGTYQMADSNFCTVFVRSDTLFYKKTNKPEVALYAETDNVFFRTGDARGRKVFLPGENGTMLLRERRNGQDVVWRRIK